MAPVAMTVKPVLDEVLPKVARGAVVPPPGKETDSAMPWLRAMGRMSVPREATALAEPFVNGA